MKKLSKTLHEIMHKEPQTVEDVLYDICESEHASCNDNCPVYRLNNHKPLNADKPFDENRGCDCFKNGSAMRKFIEMKDKLIKK